MSEQVIPPLLNKELMATALENEFKCNVKILSFKVSSATKKGDNYTSNIYRVLIKYESNGEIIEFPVIVKYLGDGKELLEIVESHNTIQKEIVFYSETLPKYQKLLNEKFSPKCYHIQQTGANIFVFEDLNHSKYEMIDRTLGTDLNHSNLVVRKLGKYHAVSMVANEQDPNLFKTHQFGMITTKKVGNGGLAEHFFGTCLRHLQECLRNIGGHERIIQKLKNIEDNFVDYLFDWSAINTPKFKVLNHGDLWITNIMFKYNIDNEPVDAQFVDHQLGFYSSMGIDWNYFFYSSVTQDVRDNNEHELLETYYESLVTTLQELNYKPTLMPTFEDVQDEVRKYQFYGLFAAVTVLPLALMERREDVDFDLESLIMSEEFKKLQFSGKAYIDAIQKLLLKFERNRVFELPNFCGSSSG